MTPFQQMRNALTAWAELTDSQWSLFSNIFKPRSVDKHAFLALPGSTKYELLFVAQGLLRFYYQAESGAESNKAFIAENGFAGPLASFRLQLPLDYGIQALEPSSLLVAQYTDFVALFDRGPVFDRLGRCLAEGMLTHKEICMRTLLLQQAKGRYQEFLRRFPELVDRVPQYHIASYLGITDVTLSRLKKDIK